MKTTINLLTVFLLIFLSNCKNQNSHTYKNERQTIQNDLKNNWTFKKSYTIKKYNERSLKDEMAQMSKDKNISSYQLMAFGKNLGGLITMYQATDTIKYFEDALTLVEDVMKQVKKGKDIEGNPKLFKDNYLGWENRNANYEKHKNGGKDKREIPLFESRFLRYVAQMLYIIENDKNLSTNQDIINKEKAIKEFVEINGWRKWFERGETKEKGCYPYLFRNRTHMTSHWAIIALYLEKITEDPKKKKQYQDFLNLYDQQLKSNLKLTDKNAYTWNMTWDNSWPYGTNCNEKAKEPKIQDVAHGNHVVAYIVEAYNLGRKNWTNIDIQRLCNTVKYVLYDERNKRFYAGLSQKIDSEFADGIRMSDGFQYLSRYDLDVFNAFELALNNKKNHYRFRENEPQYVAERHYTEKIWMKKQ